MWLLPRFELQRSWPEFSYPTSTRNSDAVASHPVSVFDRSNSTSRRTTRIDILFFVIFLKGKLRRKRDISDLPGNIYCSHSITFISFGFNTLQIVLTLTNLKLLGIPRKCNSFETELSFERNNVVYRFQVNISRDIDFFAIAKTVLTRLAHVKSRATSMAKRSSPWLTRLSRGEIVQLIKVLFSSVPYLRHGNFHLLKYPKMTLKVAKG